MADDVNEPSHYNKNGIEVIDVIETYAKTDFRLANVLKYVCRCEYKSSKLQDLQKAQWYLNRVVEELEDAWTVEEFVAEQDENEAVVTTAAYEDLEFHASLATRIAGATPEAGAIKDDYYKFDRYEIQGYCAYCEAEIAFGQPYITTSYAWEDLKFCSHRCVDKLMDTEMP